MTLFIKSVKKDVRGTVASLELIARKSRRFYFVIAHCFTKPENTLYGVISAALSVLIAFWFANIAIIQTVFASSALSIELKLNFLFTITGTLLRNMGGLQFWAIANHVILWCLISAMWLEAIKLIHDRPRLQPRLAPVILATVCIGAIAIIAISLVTPAITTSGVSIFVSSHFSGTLMLITALFAESILLIRLAAHIKQSL